MYNKLILSFVVFLCSTGIYAQLVPGEWQDHLPYISATKTVIAGDRIYCSTKNSLYYYDKSDNSINTISKVQGLTQSDISSIAYSSEYKLLIIVYNNLNIDFLKGNKITNFPYVKNKIGLPNKVLNEITVQKNKAYLSCGFGVVVIDIDKMIVLETYYPGLGGKTESIMDITFDDSYIYAASQNHIFRGNINDPFLVDNSKWELLHSFSTTSSLKSIKIFQGKLFALLIDPRWGNDSVIYYDNFKWKKSQVPVDELKTMVVANKQLVVTGNRIFILDENLSLKYTPVFFNSRYSIFDEDNTLWIADGYQSLIKYRSENEIDTIKPNSPFFAETYKMDLNGDNVWTVAGSLNTLWQNEWSRNGFAGYVNNKWNSINSHYNNGLDTVYDIVNVKINPFNTSQIYLATWSMGLILYENGNFTFYNGLTNNSTIQENIYWGGRYFVYGLAFDNKQNLWVTNFRVKKPLSVKMKDGKWKSFSLPFVSTNEYMVADVMVTSWGHKWITNANSTTMIVFDEGDNITDETDDVKTTMNLSNLVATGNALEASNAIYCITEDRDGNIWVGTDAGPVEISGAKYIFNESGVSARKIKVPTTISDDIAAFLLETEKINAITIDGGNRKWIGTQNSGAYLVSPDGVKQIAHFTAENSPLLSNTVNDIKINGKTGEIFFATDKGLISYRGYSTKGNDEFGDVYVFPNPIREDFTGDIIVTNLLTDAIIKITDISGNLVYETKAIGGQATWNGKNLIGKRVNTGVYLVFCSNDDGTKTYVTKLLFIH